MSQLVNDGKAATLRMFLLGRFEVRAGDRVVLDRTWSRRKARSLLKLLALQRNRSLHREQVLDVLWPDLEVGAAANNLHKNLHYLRTALAGAGGAGAVYLTADTVVLSPDIWTDVEEFRRLAQLARARRTDPEAYEAALALYGGDLLPEDLYDDWTEPVREELRGECIQLLLQLAQIYDRQGRNELAVDCLLRLLQLDALHEEAHRQLMRLYAQTGSRHRALRQYQTCRESLQRELGIEPSEETEQLHQQILEGRIRPQPQPAPAATARWLPDRAALPPMFGREQELEQADDLLEEAMAGRGQTLLVSGVAGIGKSRFVQQVLAAAAEQGALTLTGRSFELEATAAYQPLREVLRQVLDRVRDDGVLHALRGSLYLKRLLPEAAPDPLRQRTHHCSSLNCLMKRRGFSARSPRAARSFCASTTSTRPMRRRSGSCIFCAANSPSIPSCFSLLTGWRKPRASR